MQSSVVRVCKLDLQHLCDLPADVPVQGLSLVHAVTMLGTFLMNMSRGSWVADHVVAESVQAADSALTSCTELRPP